MSKTGCVAGWRAITVGNDVLRAIVLPERGAELHSLVHVPTETELLFQAPWGLRPPSPDRTSFLDRYAGGWQELFPSTNDETTYCGETIPFHGEVALLPWEVRSATGRSSAASAVNGRHSSSSERSASMAASSSRSA